MMDGLRRFFRVEGAGVKAPWRVFWVALGVRLAYMTLTHQYRIKPLDANFGFGYEAGRIARALATGYGYADAFSNPYMAHTGPTAWLPPVYPLLLAGVFKVFGVYTLGSAWVILAINCVFSAWTAMAVWELGARLAGMGVARWSGWLWALYPAAMQYAVKWVWEMSVTTALFAWVVVLAMRMRAEPGVRVLKPVGVVWVGVGADWAVEFDAADLSAGVRGVAALGGTGGAGSGCGAGWRGRCWRGRSLWRRLRPGRCGTGRCFTRSSRCGGTLGWSFTWGTGRDRMGC